MREASFDLFMKETKNKKRKKKKGRLPGLLNTIHYLVSNSVYLLFYQSFFALYFILEFGTVFRQVMVYFFYLVLTR